MKKFILWGGTLVQTHNTVAGSKTGTILIIIWPVWLGVIVFTYKQITLHIKLVSQHLSNSWSTRTYPLESILSLTEKWLHHNLWKQSWTGKFWSILYVKYEYFMNQ